MEGGVASEKVFSRAKKETVTMTTDVIGDKKYCYWRQTFFHSSCCNILRKTANSSHKTHDNSDTSGVSMFRKIFGAIGSLFFAKNKNARRDSKLK